MYDVYSVFLRAKNLYLNDSIYNHYTDPINVYEKINQDIEIL